MQLNRKKLFALVAVLFVLLVFFLAFIPVGPSTAMINLPIGSSYTELIDLAGSPNYETDGALWVEPEHKKSANQIIKGCVKEVWYEYWTKFIPSKYSFCFDSNNILLHKYHWSSW